MLKHDIDIKAEIIWDLLCENDALTVKEIGEITGFKEVLITMALGWLAREDKIDFFEKNNVIYVELKKIIYSEMYF